MPRPCGERKTADPTCWIERVQVPFEDLEPFGRENKAQALTEAAIKE